MKDCYVPNVSQIAIAAHFNFEDILLANNLFVNVLLRIYLHQGFCAVLKIK